MAKKSKRVAKKQSNSVSNKRPETTGKYPMFPRMLEGVADHPYLGAFAGFIYMLLILIIAIPNYEVGPYFSVVTDFYWDYVPSAQSFQEGAVSIDNYRGPMYPIALGIAGFLIPDFFTAGIVIAALSGGFFLFLIFEIVKKLFRADMAFCVMLLMAVNPVFMEYSYNPGTDMFFAALVAGVFYFLVKDNRLSYVNLGIAAFLAALAYLTRYNGLFIIGAVPLTLLLINIYQTPWTERIKGSVYFVALFFLLISPWGIYCLQEKGDFFYNKNYENIAYEVYAKGEMGWDEFWYGEGVDVSSLTEVIMKDPPRFVSNVIGNIPGHFLDDMEKLTGYEVGWMTMLGLLMLAFMVMTKQHFPGRMQLAFYLYSLLFFAVLLLVFHGPRFSLFIIPFYLVLGLQWLTIGKQPLERLAGNFNWVPILVLIVAALSFNNAYEVNKEQMDTRTGHLLDVRAQFERVVPEEERKGTVAARQPHIARVLGLDFRRLPHEQDYNRLMDELREREVEYLFYGMVEIQMWPELQFLADPNQAPAGLTPVVSLPQTREHPPVNLYRIEY